jgi:alpha-beta hydrolase superfamily lysophospholipase
MRVLLALALAVPLLAGCLSGPDPEPPAVPGLTVADVVPPSPGSWVLEPITGGVQAVLRGATLPEQAEITVPAGATMVRAVADSTASSVSMANAETGRRRCNNPTVEGFSVPFAHPKSCSSATALDAPGATWTVTFGGSGAGDLRIEFLSTPPDGLLAHLDLSQITPPTLGVQPTETRFVPSWDGTRLRVEVTLPEGPGPWPTVIESSPYHDDGLRREPASYAYFVEDWARRGYAIVVADVRGFGDSGGCVEVWGPNEQKDQAFLVDWTAAQPWSDGIVGFYGQSYVGTTPVAAAVQAPEALKAIIAVAPVINAYEDWHYGGVPNGESTGSPVAYQVLTEAFASDPTLALDERFRADPRQLANNAANGLCDPTLVARANDPRAVYDSFYRERDFKLRAGQVRAATLYTEGFEDANVKAAMIPGWFNAIQAPKLGLFGHWLHQHPPRLDTEALMVGWLEQHLKGKDLGFERLPAAVVQVDRDTERYASEWPPTQPVVTTLWPALAAGQLGLQPAEGSAEVTLDHAGVLGDDGTRLVYRGTLERDVPLAGSATMHVAGTLAGASSAYLMAELYEGDELVSFGQVNLAHNADHTQYTPIAPGQPVSTDMPFRPTERILKAGSELTLVLRGVTVDEATDPFGAAGVRFTFTGGASGVRLDLPGAPLGEYQPIALSGRP